MTIVSHVHSANGSFMSAYAITTVSQQVATVLSAVLGQSSLIVIGNTLGRGAPDRAKCESVTFIVLGLIMGVLANALIIAISPLVAGYYNITADITATLIEIGY